MSLRIGTPRLLAPQARIITPLASQTRRSFFSLPGTASQTQTLSATRILPHPLQPLYTLIADVDSYHTFVPYCTKSIVTQWDTSTSPKSPLRADLHVGWGGFTEVFTSRLDCKPGESVEAISGGKDAETDNGVFKSLVTKWSVKDVGEKGTQVDLRIRYEFANPVYAAVSAAVSDKVAGVMIEAFEKQAEERLGRKQI